MKNINYIQKERGAVFVMTALLLPIFFGFMGLAYDAGNLYMHKARLQNVADSAALAGARAFVENGEKIDGNTLITTPCYNNYNYSENDSAPSYNSNHLHSYADIAADAYIIKNIKNLHNSVKADKHSHLVLSNGSQTNPKSFFRVGLTEEVPLYFMPILLKNQWSQTINVGAIASLTKEEGEPPVVPTTTNTIFDNLYTFSNYLNVMQGTMTNPDANSLNTRPNNGGSTINMTFDGQMVYTGNNASGFYKLQDSVQHLYTSEGKEKQISQNLSVAEMGTNYTNDPKKTASPIDLNDYQDILNSKLAIPHIELNMSNTDDKNKFTVDNINDLNSSLYIQQQKDKDGNGMYSLTYGGQTLTYAVEVVNWQNQYYYYDENNQKVIFIKNNFGSYVPAYKGSGNFNDDKGQWYEGNYVLDENGNKIYYQIQNDDVYFANANKKQIAKFNRNSTNCYYTNPGSSKTVKINYIAIDQNLLGKDSDKLISKINTNVIRLTGTSNKSLDINKEVTGGGNLNEPLYIINDTNQEMQINVYADNKRPIVIIQNGTTNVRLYVYNGATFEGVIYAPNVPGGPNGGEDGVMVKLFGSSGYKGNIVAKNIGVSNSGSGSFIQVNYLKNDTELYDAIVNFAKEHGHTFGDPSITPPDNSKPPSNTYNNDWKTWYNKVGQSAANTWFNSLSQNDKIAFWRSWDLAERPSLWRILSVTKWYWDIGFGTYWWDKWIFKDWKPSDDDIQDAEDDKPVTPTVSETKLRLINPRLEENPFHNTANTAG